MQIAALLEYVATLFHGIDSSRFTFQKNKLEYLLFYGGIHPDKGAEAAIEMARQSGHPLKLAGLIQDIDYFENKIKPRIDGEQEEYMGNLSEGDGSKLLGKAKALLDPIQFDEPFGLSVAEE